LNALPGKGLIRNRDPVRAYISRNQNSLNDPFDLDPRWRIQTGRAARFNGWPRGAAEARRKKPDGKSARRKRRPPKSNLDAQPRTN